MGFIPRAVSHAFLSSALALYLRSFSARIFWRARARNVPGFPLSELCLAAMMLDGQMCSARA